MEQPSRRVYNFESIVAGVDCVSQREKSEAVGLFVRKTWCAWAPSAIQIDELHTPKMNIIGIAVAKSIEYAT